MNFEEIEKLFSKELKKFYLENKKILLTQASKGWFFADSFERHYNKEEIIDTIVKGKNQISSQFYLDEINQVNIENDAGKIIENLNNLEDFQKKFYNLKKKINSYDTNLTHDNFVNNINLNLSDIQKIIFHNQQINILIIGSGVCGLFLANTLKNKLGSKVNILVLDNRLYKKNILKIFSREWLTYLPKDILQKHTPHNIKNLFECFGVNKKVGLPINIIETILMLSCKEQGVNFYFTPEIEYSKLNDKLISIIFDATGGRLSEVKYNSVAKNEINLNINNMNFNFDYAGITQLENTTKNNLQNLKIKLKGSGSRHHPFIDDKKIRVHMIKLTSVPIRLLDNIFQFIKKNNDKNLFYVWKGSLKEELNQALIFINLNNKEFDLMSLNLNNKTNLKNFFDNKSNILNLLNQRILAFLKLIVLNDTNKEVNIEKPFIYYPYINMNSEDGYIYGNKIFPVGDSLFCGHPKMGNGLSVHLEFINKLVEKIVNIKSIDNHIN